MAQDENASYMHAYTYIYIYVHAWWGMKVCQSTFENRVQPYYKYIYIYIHNPTIKYFANIWFYNVTHLCDHRCVNIMLLNCGSSLEGHTASTIGLIPLTMERVYIDEIRPFVHPRDCPWIVRRNHRGFGSPPHWWPIFVLRELSEAAPDAHEVPLPLKLMYPILELDV